MIDFKQFEKKIYSQNGEDGVIEKIFELIGTTNKYFVEFGVEDGMECNTRYLEENFSFKGTRFDANYEDKTRNIFLHKLNRENIISVFEQYNIPHEFDLLSIDVDYNDFYLWKKLSEKYIPRVVVIEYNSNLKLDDKIVVYDQNGTWDHTNYFGASLVSLYKLGNKLEYDLVYTDENGVNAFFVKKGVLKEQVKFKNDVEKLFKHKRAYHAEDPLNRKFITYEHDIDSATY